MVDTLREQEALKEALAVCEKCLETPVIPGEAVDWVQNLNRALDELAPRFSERIQRTHRDQLDEISAQDSGLLNRVERLRVEDEAVDAELTTLHEHVGHLATGIEQAEPNEVKAEPAIEKIVDHGLDLVIRIRKQEEAISTWLVEALQRDRGEGD